MRRIGGILGLGDSFGLNRHSNWSGIAWLPWNIVVESSQWVMRKIEARLYISSPRIAGSKRLDHIVRAADPNSSTQHLTDSWGSGLHGGSRIKGIGWGMVEIGEERENIVGPQNRPYIND